MDNNFHEFRKSKNLKLQNNFIFVDTESNSNKVNDNKEVLTFKMGCSIFWNRLENKTNRFTHYSVKDFWNKTEAFFNEKNNHVIMFAHNTQFDFKMLNGFYELMNREWKLNSFYVRNRVFILVFQKVISKNVKYTLHIYDTMNYVNKKLEALGNSIGLPKLDVDFNDVSNERLEVYCQRDTEIIYLFIKRLIEFLELNDLSRLKATSGSLSFNTFRHKFYNPVKEIDKIYIHDWKRAIKLERESYKGGITDVFKVGSYNNLFKLDINSMYPSIMEKVRIPIKLLFYSHESKFSQKDLFKIYYESISRNYNVIMKATVYIPIENAYILNDYGLGKSSFAFGTTTITIAQPEINFINKFGSILRIHEINVYRTKKIFTDFIRFFYNKRIQYKKMNDDVNVEFCKLIMNTQYGKWGQKDILYKQLDIENDWLKKNLELIKIMINKKKEIIKNNQIIYLGTIINDSEIYIIDKKLYRLKQLESNSKESFVAIASFITSYARIMLVNYLKKAKRENVYYCDTDSLIVNEIGYQNLLDDIDDYKLGKLKIEGKGSGTFYAPKFYDFGNERKVKGVKKDSIILQETKDKVVYQVELWQKFKTDIKNGINNKQIIITTTKEANKIYDKGKVDSFGNVFPFSVKEIELLV